MCGLWQPQVLLVQEGDRTPWTCSLAWPRYMESIKLIGVLLSGCSATAWAPQRQECLCECRLKHTQHYMLSMFCILTPGMEMLIWAFPGVTKDWVGFALFFFFFPVSFR